MSYSNIRYAFQGSNIINAQNSIGIDVVIEPGHDDYDDLVDGIHGAVGPGIDLTPSVDDLKAAKIKEINAAAQAFVDSLAPSYPEFEQLTFGTQKEEALRWNADNTASTPNVDILAANRGMGRAELLGRIVANVASYEALAMTVAGQRQSFEDLVNAATTEAEIDAIVISYSVG